MSPDDFRNEYLRDAAARSGLLSRFITIQRELLRHLAADSGRIAVLADRDAALVVIEEFRDREEVYLSRVGSGLYKPMALLERLIECKRNLAARVGERLAELLEKKVPQEYPEPRRLYFSGTGKLVDSSEE